MSEVIYVDNDPRYIARECIKIPLTFQNCGDIECGAIVGIKSDGYGHESGGINHDIERCNSKSSLRF